MKEKPRLIKGGVAVDDRGIVTFCNEFNLQECGIKRFYTLQNHRRGFVRAWHGHIKEAKYITVLSGVAVVGATPLDTLARLCEAMDEPDPFLTYQYEREVCTFTLSSLKPSVLYIPPGYANGHMNLVDNTIVMHFSTVSMDETKGDDVRFSWDTVPGVWEVEPR